MKARFLVDQIFSLAAAHEIPMEAVGLNGVAEVPAEISGEREPKDGEEVWDVSDPWLRRERSPSAFERVKALCESLLCPVPTTAAEVQQLIENTICACADFRKLESSVKTIEAFPVISA